MRVIKSSDTVLENLVGGGNAFDLPNGLAWDLVVRRHPLTRYISGMPMSFQLLVALVVDIFRIRRDLLLENLALRQQLSCFKHGKRRPKLDRFDRLFWTLLYRFWSRWNQALVLVKPGTVVQWHRLGFKLFWKHKSRKGKRGRPRIHPDVQKLIKEMARANVGWGAPRIHGELKKLGLEVSESTISNYLAKLFPRRGGRGEGYSGQSWKTFLDNHLNETIAIDFTVVPTVTFELVYVFVVLDLETRRVLHFNVTKHPTAAWTAQQMVEACPFTPPGRFLLRDNDKIFGRYFTERVRGIGFEELRTTPHSPWQNGFVERWIGSLRRDCLNHVIAISENQLRRVVRKYVDYYHEDRTHLGLDKETPSGRLEEGPEQGKIVAFPRVGGLHHRYSRMEQKAA